MGLVAAQSGARGGRGRPRRIPGDVLAGGGANSNAWHRVTSADSGGAATAAIATMLKCHPAMFAQPLRTLVAAAATRLERGDLSRLADAALGHAGLGAEQRSIWALTAFAVDPLRRADQLAGCADEVLFALFDGHFGEGLLNAFPDGSDAEQATIAAALFARLAPHAKPYERRSGRVTQDHRLNDASNTMLKRLAASADATAATALARLLERDRAYPPWRAALRHAAAEQARARRDRDFVPPTAAVVEKALAGKAPANAADLRAIMVDELERLGRDLRTGATSPWRDFWNTDRSGKATEPKIENIARDLALTRLGPRLGAIPGRASAPRSATTR